MNIALWVVQGILAAAYGMAGFIKSTKSPDELASKMQMAWALRFSPTTVKLIGISQLLGAIGLILPWLTGIAPVLTPLAATGLAITQVAAGIHHIQHDENKSLPVNVILFALAAFVAYGRFFPGYVG